MYPFWNKSRVRVTAAQTVSPSTEGSESSVYQQHLNSISLLRSADVAAGYSGCFRNNPLLSATFYLDSSRIQTHMEAGKCDFYLRVRNES